MGIVPILRNILYPPGPNQAESSTKKPVITPPLFPLKTSFPKKPRIEIYGPAGVRAFIRTILKMTLTRTSDTYIVHELLTQDDELTPCDPPELMHSSEVSGKDIRCSPEDGFWRAFTRGSGVFGNVVVDAGPISHRGTPPTLNQSSPLDV
jgi:ribonuclease Z